MPRIRCSPSSRGRCAGTASPLSPPSPRRCCSWSYSTAGAAGGSTPTWLACARAGDALGFRRRAGRARGVCARARRVWPALDPSLSRRRRLRVGGVHRDAAPGRREHPESRPRLLPVVSGRPGKRRAGRSRPDDHPVGDSRARRCPANEPRVARRCRGLAALVGFVWLVPESPGFLHPLLSGSSRQWLSSRRSPSRAGAWRSRSWRWRSRPPSPTRRRTGATIHTRAVPPPLM